MPNTPKATRTVYIENHSSIDTHMSEKNGWALVKDTTAGRKRFQEQTWTDGSVSFQDLASLRYLHVEENWFSANWINYVDGFQNGCKFVLEDATQGKIYIRPFDNPIHYWYPKAAEAETDMYVTVDNVKGIWYLNAA